MSRETGRIEHELAGLLRPGGSPLQAADWWVPDVIEARGEELQWRSGGFGRRARPHRSMLDRFLRLATAAPDQVERFAAEFGLLSSYDGSAAEGSELLSAWRERSLEARSLLDVAAKLRTGRPVTAEDWDGFQRLIVDGTVTSRTSVYFQATIEGLSAPNVLADAAQLLSLTLADWLARVTVGFAWSSRRPARLLLSPNGLRGALGIQLAQGLTGSEGLGLACRGCGASFEARHGNQRYCGTCSATNVPRVRANKAYRRRVSSSRGYRAGDA
jgi:hypothetical protein